MSPKTISILAAAPLGAVQLVLIATKLLGHIHHPWWIVLAPVGLPIVVAILAALVIIAMFAGSADGGSNPFQ